MPKLKHHESNDPQGRRKRETRTRAPVYRWEHHLLSFADEKQMFYFRQMKVDKMLIVMVITSFTAFGSVAAQEGMSSLNALGGARAYSGHDIEIGDSRFLLRGVTCADPATENGRRAKALANTFLRMQGKMKCESAEGIGDCLHLSASGIRRFSEVMLKTRLCWSGAL